MSDYYSVAAIRHLVDANLLYENHRFDNAMCHYAFSVECVLKAFLSAPLRSHQLNILQDLVCTYSELLALFHPKFMLLFGIEKIPPILVQDHPERRYFEDINYTEAEMQQVQIFTNSLVNKMTSAVLNGQINRIS